MVYRWGYENLIRYSFPLLMGAHLFAHPCFYTGDWDENQRRPKVVRVLRFPIGQPSESVKVLLPAAYIGWFLKQSLPIELARFLKILGWLSIPVALILFEPDNGTTFIIFLLFVILSPPFPDPVPMYRALPLFALSLLGAAAAYQMPHVHNRLQVYLHPELDLRGKGHQPHQAKIAAGSGQLFGRGIGESLQKLNYLPEARSDYIAAIYAEETGFIGILALISLYIILTSAGFVIAIRSQERSPFLLAATLTFLISIQAFLNLGVVSGLLPSKGMTLPYFSQGGSSLMVNIVVLFILLDISRKQVCALSKY